MTISSQADVLRHTIDALERLQIPYLVCGSFASGTFGEPRMTLDIDIVVQLNADTSEKLCGELTLSSMSAWQPPETLSDLENNSMSFIHAQATKLTS